MILLYFIRIAKLEEAPPNDHSKWVGHKINSERAATRASGEEPRYRESVVMAESEGEVSFSSIQEELEYWKEKALEYRQRYILRNR